MLQACLQHFLMKTFLQKEEYEVFSENKENYNKILREVMSMKEYSSANLRNIAVVGQGKAGKTTLLEACLFNAGAVTRLGKVDEGTSVLDFEAEETKRRLTLSSAIAACEWQGYKLNFIDTPGYPDFVGEVKSALQAADNALIVISAPSGIEVETEKVWRYAESLNLPRAIFINKMDREHADFNRTVEELRVKFGPGVVPIQLPIGTAAAFQGVADLLKLHTKIVTSQEEILEGAIPEYLEPEVELARQQLIETVAEYNNELLEKYIEGQEISEVEIAAALIEGIQAAKIFPVLCGSGYQNVGVKKMMNAAVEYLMTPYFKTSLGIDPATGDYIERRTEDAFSAQVFKTVVDPMVGRLSFIRILSGTMKGDTSYYNSARDVMERVGSIFTVQGKRQLGVSLASAGDIVVAAKLASTNTGDTLCDKTAPIRYEKIDYPESMMTLAIKAKQKDDEDKIGVALSKQQEEDPTLRVIKDRETRELLISGIGEVHLDIALEKMQRKFGVEALLTQPAVAYRETIRKLVKVEGKHKKQSGGHGQYGHVWLEIEPLPAGSGNEFTETIFGGSVPRQYIPAVEKGTAETLQGGVLAGYPVVDVKVNLYDGSYHAVDSSEMAFKTATAQAIRKGILEASPLLLEPICDIRVCVPEYYMGDVIGDLNAKRARIMGMESGERGQGEIKAQIPQGELYKYATDLRSLTQGRGSFSLQFSHYEEMPVKKAEVIIEKAKAKLKKAEE